MDPIYQRKGRGGVTIALHVVEDDGADYRIKVDRARPRRDERAVQQHRVRRARSGARHAPRQRLGGNMKTPDLSPAQLVAALSALVTACVVLFKLNLTGEQQAALVSAIGTIVPTAWLVADAIIRHGRSANAAAQANLAAAVITNSPADGDDSLVDPAVKAK